MSNHACTVYRFRFEETIKHSNADNLSIWKIPETDYTYVLRTDDWRNKNCLVSWLPPDTLISYKHPQVSFLAVDAKYGPGKDLIRIKGKRLRGIMSYGLLAELPEDCGLTEGEDAASYFQTDWYSPEVAEATNGGKRGLFPSGEIAQAPSITVPYYDLENAERYARKVFIEGEPLLIMEKMEGENSAFVCHDGQMHCRSRTQWKKEFSTPPKITLEELITKIGDEEKAKLVYDKAVVQFKSAKSKWWQLLEIYPQIRRACEENPGYVLFGESFGYITRFWYGSPQPKQRFAGFDVLRPNGQWMDSTDMLAFFAQYEIPTAPIIDRTFPFNFDKLKTIVTDMKSYLPGAEKQISEGICVRPLQERWNERLGRVHVKLKNPAYLEIK